MSEQDPSGGERPPRIAPHAVQRDILLLYHQLAGAPPFLGEPAPYLEPLDFAEVYTLPYWECLDMEGLLPGRRQFINEGCLVFMMLMALDAIASQSDFRDKIPLCRTAIERLDLSVDRVRTLARITLVFLDAAERGEARVTEEMQHESSYVVEEYVSTYFRRMARQPRARRVIDEESPAETDRASMDRHIRVAEEAYKRLYRARSDAEAAAAYNDCKESLSDAIALARKLELDPKVEELEKKREHWKAVYRSQFGR